MHIRICYLGHLKLEFKLPSGGIEGPSHRHSSSIESTRGMSVIQLSHAKRICSASTQRKLQIVYSCNRGRFARGDSCSSFLCQCSPNSPTHAVVKTAYNVVQCCCFQKFRVRGRFVVSPRPNNHRRAGERSFTHQFNNALFRERALSIDGTEAIMCRPWHFCRQLRSGLHAHRPGCPDAGMRSWCRGWSSSKVRCSTAGKATGARCSEA